MDAAKVPGVLAVMATAGLYDDSGKWLYHTGLPAKSGVGGGIIAVSPGKFGIAVVSPPLDDAGQQHPRAAGDRRHLERARRQPVRARNNAASLGNGSSESCALAGIDPPALLRPDQQQGQGVPAPASRTPSRMQTLNIRVRNSGFVLRLVLGMLLVAASGSAQSSGNAAGDSPQPATGTPGTTQTPVHDPLRVDEHNAYPVRRGHVVRCRAGEFVWRSRLPAGKDVGLRRQGHLGVGRLRRRIRRGPDDGRADGRAKTPEYVPNAGFLSVRRREGADLFPALQLRALSQSAQHRRVLHGRLRGPAHRSAAPGHSAGEVLRAVLRLVHDAEVPLLPVRLVVERVAGRSGAGRRRRQSELRVQSLRHGGRRHHVVADRAQHGRPVPVLARASTAG